MSGLAHLVFVNVVNPVAMNVRAHLTPTACLLCTLLVGTTPAAAQNETRRTVRIRLLDANKITHAELRAVGGTLRLTAGADASTLARLDPGEQAMLSTRGTDVSLSLGQGGLYTEALHVHPVGDARWSVTPQGETTRTYGGPLVVRSDSADPGRLQLVNVVPLADYVAGVVSSEYTLDDEEGVKAMAVVARTYALHASAAAGKHYDHVDHVGAQVYRGLATVTPEARAAVQATRGEVLTHDGRIIQAVYSSSSGGHTADNEDVWDTEQALPYLRGKRDPYDINSPHANWRASIPRDILLQVLSEHYALDVQGFRLGTRSEDDRVQTIELLLADGRPHRVRSNDFRLLVNRRIPGVNLKSTLFDARRDDDRYVFEGRGFGHGVGLNQWGAHEMARRGHDYRDILSFYYTDVAITSLDDAELTPLTPTPIAATEDDETPNQQKEKNTVRRIGW